jgi:hypothetical protein
MSPQVRRIVLALIVSIVVAVAVAVPAAFQLDDRVIPGAGIPTSDDGS